MHHSRFGNCRVPAAALAIAMLVAFAGSCSESTEHRAPPTFGDTGYLEVVGRFRFGGVAGKTPPLTAPVAVAADHYGRVFVLDAEWNRIIVFNADGSYAKTIGGPQTAGWDVLRMPVAMALAGDDSLLILEWASNALVTVDTNGSILRVSPTRLFRILSIACSHGRVFVSTQFRDGGKAVAEVALGDTLEMIAPYVDTDSVMRAYSAVGSSGVIGGSGDGPVVFAPGPPGKWSVLNDSAPDSRLVGKYLYGDYKWTKRNRSQDPPAQARAVAPGPEHGEVMLSITETTVDAASGQRVIRPRLVVLNRDGVSYEVRLPEGIRGKGFLTATPTASRAYYLAGEDQSGAFVAEVVVHKPRRRPD